MRRLRRGWWVLVLTVCTLAAPAAAHPLGNFTINHLAQIRTAGGSLRVHYVLDIAEIPTFQIMHAQDGAWSAAVMRRWADGESNVVREGLKITVNGKPLSLQALGSHARLRPGAGGLPILYWTGDFRAPLPATVSNAVVNDGVYADRRIGWKDIIIGAQTEPTQQLQHYPSALIGSPRRISSARFTLSPNGAISQVAESEDAAPQIGSTASIVRPTLLSEMFSRPNQTPLFVLLTVLAAFGLGALHAIEPGHGKALLAFTLVGARATSKQAVILATSLTIAHTAGVLLLGLVLFSFAGFVSESIYPWITLISGAAIAIIGARVLARYVQMRRGLSHAHAHRHDGAHPHAHAHDHDRDHDAAQGHGHAHAIPGSQPLNFRGAIWAAMSGGIAPCPAAIVVLLAALRLHHIGYGVFLIVVFSMGLAAVLSGIGIGVVHGAAWLSRRSGYARAVAYGPLLTAIVISAIGAWTLGQGFVQQGIAVSAPFVAALTLAAIGGYAFSAHGHRHVPSVPSEVHAV